MRTSILWGVANAAAAGALWGIIFLAPAVLPDFSPLELSVGRYLAYGVLSAIMLASRWKSLRPRLGRREWSGLFELSLTGNLVYFVLLAFAVQTAGGAASSLIVGLVPVVVTLVALRDPASIPLRHLLPALALSISGVTLVGWQALASEQVSTTWTMRLLGLLCAFGALLSWSAYSIRNSRWLARRPDISGYEWSLLIGVMTGLVSLVLVPVSYMASTQTHPAGRWMAFAAVSAGLAIMASILGNAFWNKTSRLLPMSLAGQMIVFETIFALIYTFVWQLRWPTLIEGLAIVCMLAGVVLCARAHDSGRHGVTSGD
ncbi:drug/metabolite transporter (DMT)-like permease [Luteibacter sp. Sphag1AF]|uniref:DMT family transporter n=1 Tax=Luteibacter sp. Sphag1AF TaxID=2587031 RepID=UPI00162205C3|nr:DMT family transporter [Luteibacter sp. Sphag1AF]MBB3228235.1 drug/metabolite transporter (DMT)-like permease [Luteibacter sp. Sphag1AF]